MAATPVAPAVPIVAARARHLRNAIAGLAAGLYAGILVGLLKRPAK
jgi:hypothetical protein